MSRVFILVLDSLGIGGAPDAARFGDTGADTLGHIAAARDAGGAPLRLPNLCRFGLGAAAEIATGAVPAGLSGAGQGAGIWGAAAEISRGKDTPSGHWEMAGCPVVFDWGYFPAEAPSFPADLTDALIAEAGLTGVLGNKAASGTAIIAELGDAHLATLKPILYTSGDSVLQIAAHEEAFGLDRLIRTCHIARRLVDPYNIGRVIARPFIGASGGFKRTANRQDFAVPPPGPTLLDRQTAAGRPIISIGKIGDIFAHRGTGTIVKADGNMALFDATLAAAAKAPPGSLVLTNFVDFDTLYGHRRDVAGYAACLEAFDARLPELERVLSPGDLVLLSADHGCDPTWAGTDHTRECVPVLGFGPGIGGGAIGRRASFADLGETAARHLGLPALGTGAAFPVVMPGL
jgi:phosphopentomutase